MQAVVVTADSFECDRYNSLWIYWHSHTTIAMALKLYQISLSEKIPSVNDASTSSARRHSPFLPGFQWLRKDEQPFGQNHLCWRVVTCDSGPELESEKFYRLQLRLRPKTVDSDRPQLRSRPRLRSPGRNIGNYTSMKRTSPAEVIYSRDWNRCAIKM